MNLTTFDKLYLGLTLPAVAGGAAYLWPGVLDWPHLGIVVSLQIGWLAAATLLHAARVLGWPGAVWLGGLAMGISWLLESRPLRGAVFGSDYDYADFLGPHLPGGVPVTIPLMWFGMCYLALLYTSWLVRQPVIRAIVCGYTLCAFDLLLDPIATATGTFNWHDPGAYFSTPLWNFAGWFGIGAVVCGGFFVVQHIGSLAAPTDTAGHGRIAGLLGLAAFVLPALFAVQLGRGVAALLFAIAFAPVAALWLNSLAFAVIAGRLPREIPQP